ncbi:hypothetical protein HWV62_5334 [Athelia sp. TMB]|nr:hypothetical protein HWV62_5334 [Athelia sp. TMB]
MQNAAATMANASHGSVAPCSPASPNLYSPRRIKLSSSLTLIGPRPRTIFNQNKDLLDDNNSLAQCQRMRRYFTDADLSGSGSFTIAIEAAEPVSKKMSLLIPKQRKVRFNASNKTTIQHDDLTTRRVLGLGIAPIQQLHDMDAINNRSASSEIVDLQNPLRLDSLISKNDYFWSLAQRRPKRKSISENEAPKGLKRSRFC